MSFVKAGYWRMRSKLGLSIPTHTRLVRGKGTLRPARLPEFVRPSIGKGYGRIAPCGCIASHDNGILEFRWRRVRATNALLDGSTDRAGHLENRRHRGIKPDRGRVLGYLAV